MGVEELQLVGVVRMHEHRQHPAPRPGHPLLRARLPDRGRTITGIAGLPGQNAIPDINDYRVFGIDRRQTMTDARWMADYSEEEWESIGTRWREAAGMNDAARLDQVVRRSTHHLPGFLLLIVGRKPFPEGLWASFHALSGIRTVAKDIGFLTSSDGTYTNGPEV
jgi:hypothetical protein